MTTSSLSELISGLRPLPSLRADKKSTESSTSLQRDEPTSRKTSRATPAELLVSSTEAVDLSSPRFVPSEPTVNSTLGYSRQGVESSRESQSQSPIVFDAINFKGWPMIDSVEEEPYTIKCICEYSDDDGNTIYCEKCDTWQHIECYYPRQVEDASREEFDHSCADCKPRLLLLDRNTVPDRQRLQRQQKASERSPPKTIQLSSLKHRSRETKTIGASSSFESSDHEIRPTVTTDDAGQLQLLQVQGPQGHRKQSPSSSDEDHERDVQPPTRNYTPEPKVSQLHMDSPRSREGRGQQALEQASPEEPTRERLQKLTSDPYASYEDGQAFVIGVQRGSYFQCGHLGGTCDWTFISSERLHTHFVLEHFPCLGYMGFITCQHCSWANTDLLDSCTNCYRTDALESSVYSTFYRSMYSKHQEAKKKAEETRKDIIHLLAVEPLSIEDLKDRLPDTHYGHLLENLMSIAVQDDSGLWRLSGEWWKLDVWEYDYDWEEDRQRAIKNAVIAYDDMQLDIAEPEWERLLSPDERGTGKCLSKFAATENAVDEQLGESSETSPSSVARTLASPSEPSPTGIGRIETYVPRSPSGTRYEMSPSSYPVVPVTQSPSPPPPPLPEPKQDYRLLQQPSSYWSVPEQTDFPALLAHFGTNWHGIAKWMTSKTHIMVRPFQSLHTCIIVAQ